MAAPPPAQQYTSQGAQNQQYYADQQVAGTMPPPAAQAGPPQSGYFYQGGYQQPQSNYDLYRSGQAQYQQNHLGPPGQYPRMQGQWPAGTAQYPPAGGIPQNGAYPSGPQQGYGPSAGQGYPGYYQQGYQGPPQGHYQGPPVYQQGTPAVGYPSQGPPSGYPPQSTSAAPPGSSQNHKSPLQSLQKMLPTASGPTSNPQVPWPSNQATAAPVQHPPHGGYQNYPPRGSYYPGPSQFEGYPNQQPASGQCIAQTPNYGQMSQPSTVNASQPPLSPSVNAGSCNNQNGSTYPRSGTPGSLPPPASPASSCSSVQQGAQSTAAPEKAATNGNGTPSAASTSDQRRASVESEAGSYQSAGSATPGPQSASAPQSAVSTPASNEKRRPQLPTETVPSDCFSQSSQCSGGQGNSRPPSTTGSIGPIQSDVSSSSASPASSADQSQIANKPAVCPSPGAPSPHQANSASMPASVSAHQMHTGHFTHPHAHIPPPSSHYQTPSNAAVPPPSNNIPPLVASSPSESPDLPQQKKRGRPYGSKNKKPRSSGSPEKAASSAGGSGRKRGQQHHPPPPTPPQPQAAAQGSYPGGPMPPHMSQYGQYPQGPMGPLGNMPGAYSGGGNMGQPPTHLSSHGGHMPPHHIPPHHNTGLGLRPQVPMGPGNNGGIPVNRHGHGGPPMNPSMYSPGKGHPSGQPFPPYNHGPPGMPMRPDHHQGFDPHSKVPQHHGIAGHPMPAMGAPNSNGNMRDMKSLPLETCPVPAISHAPPPPEGVKITKVLNNHLPAALKRGGPGAVSGPFSGPFLRLKGSPVQPKDVRIINGKNANDKQEDGGSSSKHNKVSSAGRSGADHAKKAGTAIHLSTLSPGYDTVTRDPTWICALCLTASHEHNLGDLFGPYFWTISTPPPVYILDAMRKLAVKVNAQKTHLVDASDDDEHHATGGKSKRKSSTQMKRKKMHAIGGNPLNSAEVPLSSEQEEKIVNSLRAEYWIHEDCVCYTQGVYLDAKGIPQGLEEAIREAARITCSQCGQPGATLACVARHCNMVMHVHCARQNNAFINSANFSLLCSRHKGQQTSARQHKHQVAIAVE